MRTCQNAFQALQVIIILTLLLFFLPAPAQNRIASPYSIFGLGELKFNQNINNTGMGGLGVAFRSNRSINEVNPASYAAIDSMSFLFEANVSSHFYQQQTQAASQSGNYTSLGSLMFGSRVTKWWAFGFGLKPFSSMGYKIRDAAVDDKVGTMNFLYEGDGGINQVFFGSAITPFKGFSAGFNASYLFGRLERHTTAYSDSTGIFLTNRIDRNQVNGWHLGMGTQYHTSIGNHGALTIGLIYGMEQEIGVKHSEIIRRGFKGSAQFDTLSVSNERSGSFVMPVYWGGGVFARFNQRWQGGVDYQRQNWADYSMLGTQGGLLNTYQVTAGVQYNAGVQTFSNFFSILDYRAGFRYGQTYLNPYGHALDEFGISFGIGIPLRLALSKVNVGVEMARRGTTDHNLMEENIFRIHVGVNIYERWFLRRRFF